MSAPVPFSEALKLDAELVRLARGASALRLTVGEALEALSSSGGHHELGFSSLEAYARERCERTGRWASDTRALAQRLRVLPGIRDALRTGAIGWSTAELLARYVTAESEHDWLEKARGATVRELRALLARPDERDEEDAADELDAACTLTVSATREDGWLFEYARKVAEAVAGPMPADRLLQTLLAEGYSTLLELVPDAERSGLYDIESIECDVQAEMRANANWCAERERWRNEAEALCGQRWSSCELESSEVRVESQRIGDAERAARASEQTAEALDLEIRRWCSELCERDLALGIAAESARKAEVWRRLGFATEAQYARERLGVSLSSLKAKRILAARAARVPELSAALSSGRVGYEAAYLLSRVVTPSTAADWIRRAEGRTVKHLREEVEAAELLMSAGLGREQAPLDEESVDELFELERSIVSGDWFGRSRDSWAGEGARSEARGGSQMFGGVSAHGANGEGRGGSQMSGGVSVHGADGVGRAGSQMSGGVSAHERANDTKRGGSQMSGERRRVRLACVTMRWGVTLATQRFWRALERVFVRSGVGAARLRRLSSHRCRGRTSFLAFLCENFCRIWLPALRQLRLTESGELPEYFGVYRRDVFRCMSPVCTRRDVTPHHLVFRSRGGGDEAENVASLCVWCHLHGVHEGRIAAEPPASRIRWRIGRAGTLRVDGRTRQLRHANVRAQAPQAFDLAVIASSVGRLA